jgi:hypothetical protein
MGTYTTPGKIYVPAFGENGWDDEMGANLNRLSDLPVNVKTYGAVGNGTADDTVAIQTALNSGAKTVFLPPGSYKITNTLVVPSQVALIGSHMTESTLLHRAGANPCIQVNYISANCRFENFGITGDPGATGTGDGIYLAGATGGSSYITRTYINRVQFKDVGDATHWALRCIWALETYVNQCDFFGCLGGGVMFGDTSNASVLRDTTMSNGGNGALGGVLINASGILVEGCVIEAWRGDYGLKVQTGNANVNTTWFEDNYNDDLYVSPGTGLTLVSGGVSETSAAQYLNAVYVEPGTGSTLTELNMIGFGGTGRISLNNGASDLLSVVMVAASVLGQGGDWFGDLDLTGITTPASFSLIRIGGRRDKFGAGPPLAAIELQGLGSALRLEEAKIFWGTSAQSATWGDTTLYRSAANTLKTDDQFIAADGLTGRYKSGAGVTNVADGDFTVTPPNGTIAVAHDTTTGFSYMCIRANGVWKSVEATV